MAEKKLEILVADDQENMRQLFARVLQSLGYQCDVATDGRDCLGKLSHKSYDVVFLDLILPEVDGETVLRWVRRQFPDTYVVISSVQDDEGIIRDMLALGAKAYLVKPFTNYEIQNVIHAIENRRTASGLAQVAIGSPAV